MLQALQIHAGMKQLWRRQLKPPHQPPNKIKHRWERAAAIQAISFTKCADKPTGLRNYSIDRKCHCWVVVLVADAYRCIACPSFHPSSPFRHFRHVRCWERRRSCFLRGYILLGCAVSILQPGQAQPQTVSIGSLMTRGWMQSLIQATRPEWDSIGVDLTFCMRDAG